MYAILKSMIMSFMLEGGIIPGYSVGLFVIPERQETIAVDRSFYSDMKFNLEMMKYFNVGAGMTSYQWGTTKREFYPFRMDFNCEVNAKYKAISFGYSHSCFHPIAPNTAIFNYGKVDAGYNRVFFRLKIENGLFK